MILNNRLKSLRQEKDITQEGLARTVGVTRQTIIAIEKGKFAPSVRLALEIAATMQVPLEQVFWLSDRHGGGS